MADQPDAITEAAKKIAWSMRRRLRTRYDPQNRIDALWSELSENDRRACLDAARAIQVPAAKLEAQEMLKRAEAFSRAAIRPGKEAANGR